MIYPATDQYIDLAKNTLENGEVIVYTTDTLSGFGVDARNKLAISRLNEIKRRRSPMSVIMHDKNMVLSCIDIPQKHHYKINKYLKAKSTIIIQVKSGVVHPDILGDNKSLGIRIPDHNFGPILCKRLGFPITTTSVNRTGNMPLNDPNKIIKAFDGEFDLLIDDGIMQNSRGSTIYKFENSRIKVLRK